MAQRYQSVALNNLVASIAHERSRGRSTRIIAEEFGLAEATIRDLTAGRRGLREDKAVAALHRFEMRERPAVPVAGGGFAHIEPKTRRDRSNLMAFYNADRRAREQGNWRVVETSMQGRATIMTADGPVRLETDPRRLQELSNAGIGGPYRNIEPYQRGKRPAHNRRVRRPRQPRRTGGSRRRKAAS
jgi:hypothetical protein